MSVKKIVKKAFAPLFRKYDILLKKQQDEIDSLYKMLYNEMHNLDHSLQLSSNQTVDAFGFQWKNLQAGEMMLSDAWFRENIETIICENEILLKKEWFKGKEVIDCGCGGGRWSYGLAKMGANITAVDINQSAIEATREVLKDLPVRKEFVQTPLEQLSAHLPAGKKFDLVWAWGVLHHCGSFNTAFREVMKCVKEGGFIYLYLYGRESLSYNEDINLFKNRVKYNSLTSWDEKEQFLLEKSNGDPEKLHQNHDIYAPLLNRRLEFDYVKKMLEEHGFTDVTRTIQTGELNIRAVKGKLNPADKAFFNTPSHNPSWTTKYFK